MTYFMACLKCIFFISGLLVFPVSSKPSYDSNNREQSCDYIKKESSGEILSPNYPLQYPAGKECSWTIMIPVFQKVVVVFETFNLEPTPKSNNCEDSDYVEVYDGSSDSIGKYCAGAGNIPPRQITSSGNMLRVVFKSDNRTTLGFHGYFRAIYASCGGYFTDPSGNLASPSYPKRFPADIQCHWQIRVPSDYVIELRFTDFNMDGKYPCNVDYVKVVDGLNTSATEIGHFCSTRLPRHELIRSTGNKMSLEFKSYRESNSRGFKAHYSRVPHCTGFLESDFGRFTSPGYPGSRKMDKECNWFITVTEGKIVSLMFEFFEVDSETSTLSMSGDCGDDYVEVFDGTGDNDKSLGRFCTINNKPTGMVRSTGRQMLVRLKTSFKNSGKGFLASYYGMDLDNYFEGCDEFDHQLLFTCNSGKKIQCQLKCDGTNDCLDASDEHHCKPIVIPTSQKSNEIRNYVIVILSITGSALAVVCIGFIVDRLRKKRTSRPRRRRQGRRRPRISSVDHVPLTDEPSSPPPPYELSAGGSVCSYFDVSFIPSRVGGPVPPGGVVPREDVIHNRSNHAQNQCLAANNEESPNPDNARAQEIPIPTAQDNAQETQTVSSLQDEEGETVSVNASVGTISPSESISSFNDTVPLIRRSESVIEV